MHIFEISEPAQIFLEESCNGWMKTGVARIDLTDDYLSLPPMEQTAILERAGRLTDIMDEVCPGICDGRSPGLNLSGDQITDLCHMLEHFLANQLYLMLNWALSDKGLSPKEASLRIIGHTALALCEPAKQPFRVRAVLVSLIGGRDSRLGVVPDKILLDLFKDGTQSFEEQIIDPNLLERTMVALQAGLA